MSLSFKYLNILFIILVISYINGAVFHKRINKNKIINEEKKNEAELVNNFLKYRRQDDENKMMDNFVAKYVVFGEEPKPCMPDHLAFVEYDDTDHEDSKLTQTTIDYEIN